ncbi:MAG: YnfA family protein [Cyanobacteria bacterium K_DeepCast_35m_m2_023]|nr:YnfA family protein [Cyanobacteria bacterium K_DeepCast_35m_m2_023]
MLRTALLFVLTAVAEIVGCYLPYLWLREGKSPLLLIPAALSLALFARLLTLHPSVAGRVYAAWLPIEVPSGGKTSRSRSPRSSWASWRVVGAESVTWQWVPAPKCRLLFWVLAFPVIYADLA